MSECVEVDKTPVYRTTSKGIEIATIVRDEPIVCQDETYDQVCRLIAISIQALIVRKAHEKHLGI